jgi:hypothetical protein
MGKKNAKIATQFWEPPFPFFQNYNPVLRATISVFSKLQPSFESHHFCFFKIATQF